MTLEKEPENRAVSAMKAAGRIAEEYGVSDMTLDEISISGGNRSEEEY